MNRFRVTTPTALGPKVTDQLAWSEEQAKSLHYRSLYARHGGDIRTTGPATTVLIESAEIDPVPI